MTFTARQPEDLNEVVTWLLKNRPQGGIILLQGDLGVGKTALVKRFCLMSGATEATSPTFSLYHRYPGQPTIHHYDLYMRDLSDFLVLGLFETLEEEGFHFIEWADDAMKRRLEAYGMEYLTITIRVEDTIRIVEVIP
ncbi:MAG: tRNA (adenosine(37)-N6)-threonylcarbamoyltransferase complex ATPase subunit type 1 TsaE [Campylobacterales bacterium]